MVRVAEEWFAVCGGCERSLLDIGEPLLDVLPHLEIVHMPVLMDHKLLGQCGDGKKLEIPEADLGIITGGIRNEENRELALEMRKKCKIIVALGTCACFGGIPALANLSTTEEMMEQIYSKEKGTEKSDSPSDKSLPKMLDRVYAVDEMIKVDIHLPGCPPTPAHIAELLGAVLEGKSFALPERSVCDTCPTIREKQSTGGPIKRSLQNAQFTPGRYDNMRCLNEQGLFCLGPVTKAGCNRILGADPSEEIPRCIKAYMPCRGCFGPIRQGSNPTADMMGSLSYIGRDPKEIVDRVATINRFIGSGRLRPQDK
ncbi:MAG: methyl viologen-reducing hydrogenase [Dehalococcoides mccartyi]